MSNLPHPLGDSVAGDLFYPGSPSVIAVDIPSSAGSRAVEFGEDGLSSAVNRGLYALAKNEEYIQARMEQSFARPELVTFTPAGANGGSYTFSLSLWCGDGAYLPENQNVRNGLISVMDDKYNDLIDPVSGDVIVVKEILDAPAGTSQVGTGFVTNPYIVFRRMDPISGALGANYTIPDGVKVWLACGVEAQLDQLVGGSASDLQDSWFRGYPRAIGEIHAATFVKDGSRLATGNFQMNDNNLENVNNVIGKSLQSLTLKGLGSGGHVDLYSEDLVRFRDQYNGSFVPLNDGDVGITGFHTSMLSSLNSKTSVLSTVVGNRTLNRTGSFTYTPGTGQIDYPALDLTINGERRSIAAGNFVATNTGSTTYVTVVTAAGAVQEKSPFNLSPTDIPLEAHAWNGSAFVRAFDIRWQHNGSTHQLEVTCGAGSCDFAPNEFAEAVELTCRLGEASSAGTQSHTPILRVMGIVRAPIPSPSNITLSAPIEIVGVGIGNSIIVSDGNNGAAVDFINCAGHRVTVKNLTVMHSGNIQGVTRGAFKNPGDHSVFQDLKFDKDGLGNDIGFANAFIWTQAASHVLIDRVEAIGLRYSFVQGASPTSFFTAYLTESRIRDCQLSWEGSAYIGCVVRGDGNVVENVTMAPGLSTYGIMAGNDTLIDRCKIHMAGATGISPAGVYYYPSVPPTVPSYNQSCIIRDSHFLQIPGSGVQADNMNNAGILARVVVRNSSFAQVNKPIDFSNVVLVSSASSTIVDGCHIVDTNEFIASYEGILKNRFINNDCNSIGGDGLHIHGGAGCSIVGNQFEGYGTAGVNKNLLQVDIGLSAVDVKDNVFGSLGAPANSSQVEIWRKCGISGNSFIGSATAIIGLELNSYLSLFPFPLDAPAAIGCLVSGNVFADHYIAGIKIDRGTGTIGYYGGQNINNNHFTGMPQTATAVWINDVEGVTVSDNEFVYMDATGVLIVGVIYGGANCHVKGNRFKEVKGLKVNTTGDFGVVTIVGTFGGCANCVVSDNIFQECGSDTGLVLHDQSMILLDAANYAQVSNNHITSLNGRSSLAGGGDICHGIKLSSYCNYSSVLGNHIFHNFGILGRVAWSYYGIRVLGVGCSIVGNFVRFIGVQGDANSTQRLYGIEASTGSSENLLAVNKVNMLSTVSGVVISKSVVNTNNFGSDVGNYADGGDLDFTAAGSTLMVGNYHGTTGSLLYAVNPLTLPDNQYSYSASAKVPISDVNHT